MYWINQATGCSHTTLDSLFIQRVLHNKKATRQGSLDSTSVDQLTPPIDGAASAAAATGSSA